MFTTLMNDLAGTKFKIINGYNETAAAMLALERGEVEGVIRPWEGMRAGREKDWLANGSINLVAQFAVQRHPDLRGVGAVDELLTTDQQHRILRLFLSANEIGRALALPPGVPADRVRTMQTAFEEMMRDPDFLHDAEKLRIALNPAPAEVLVRRTADTLDAPLAVIETARRYYPNQ
jgi:hypothetical protein